MSLKFNAFQQAFRDRLIQPAQPWIRRVCDLLARQFCAGDRHAAHLETQISPSKQAVEQLCLWYVEGDDELLFAQIQALGGHGACRFP